MLAAIILGIFTEITPIADIQANPANYVQVTVQGVVIIGVGVLDKTMTRVFIQDDSGYGIMLFDYNQNKAGQLTRGNLVNVTGKVEEYQGITEITNFTVTFMESDKPLPNPRMVSLIEAYNNKQLEGTFINVKGAIAKLYEAGGGYNLELQQDATTYTIRIWNTTGIDVSSYKVGDRISANGIGSIYQNVNQMLLGYQEDLAIDTVSTHSFSFDLLSDKQVIIPGEQVAISYSTEYACQYRLAVYSPNGQLYKLLAEGTGPTDNQVIWDGRDRFLRPLTIGAYIIMLEVPAQNQRITKGIAINCRD